MPEGAVYVGRPSKWGNEWTKYDAIAYDVPVSERPAWMVRRYQRQLEVLPFPAVALDELRGKDLVCWCPLDQPCHADVLLRLANG
jgi:hypothetical protein